MLMGENRIVKSNQNRHITYTRYTFFIRDTSANRLGITSPSTSDMKTVLAIRFEFAGDLLKASLILSSSSSLTKRE